MLGNNFERLEVDNIKGNNPDKQRIFQKLFFGKIILEPEFFDIKRIEDTDIYFLKVKQLDQNTRAVILGNDLYKFNPDNPLYNYLDNDRAFCYGKHYFIFNDLKVNREDLKIVNNWQDDKDREINFKQIWELPIKSRYDNSIKVYLIFNEDIERIKTEVFREEELRKHEEIQEKKERAEQEILEKQKERLFKETRNNFMTLPRIEDKDIIIEGNYFIEKEKGLKIEFTRKVIDIFTKDDLINDYAYNNENFISLGYRNFMTDLARTYYIGRNDTPLDEKIKKLNLSNRKYQLHFKIYSYNVENKTEEFLIEIKIENKHLKGKYKFLINGIKIPKQKMNFALRFLGAGDNYGAIETEILINRFRNLNTSLQQIKKYSGTQLELLNGKEFEVVYQNVKIPLRFEISNPDFDKDNWQVNFNGYKVKKTYNDVKQAIWYKNYSDIVNGITQISEFLGSKIEDKIIDYAKGYIEKRKQAEQKARQLFLDFIARNQSRIIPKDNYYIIKGKLKNYKLSFKNDNEVGAWTYPNNNYVCINERDKKGSELVGYDKMLQFALALLNDSEMREEVSTLQ